MLSAGGVHSRFDQLECFNVRLLFTIGVIRDDLSIESESSGDEEESLVPAICLSALTGAATLSTVRLFGRIGG